MKWLLSNKKFKLHRFVISSNHLDDLNLLTQKNEIKVLSSHSYPDVHVLWAFASNEIANKEFLKANLEEKNVRKIRILLERVELHQKYKPDLEKLEQNKSKIVFCRFSVDNGMYIKITQLVTSGFIEVLQEFKYDKINIIWAFTNLEVIEKNPFLKNQAEKKEWFAKHIVEEKDYLNTTYKEFMEFTEENNLMIIGVDQNSPINKQRLREDDNAFLYRFPLLGHSKLTSLIDRGLVEVFHKFKYHKTSKVIWAFATPDIIEKNPFLTEQAEQKALRYTHIKKEIDFLKQFYTEDMTKFEIKNKIKIDLDQNYDSNTEKVNTQNTINSLKAYEKSIKKEERKIRREAKQQKSLEEQNNVYLTKREELAMWDILKPSNHFDWKKNIHKAFFDASWVSLNECYIGFIVVDSLNNIVIEHGERVPCKNIAEAELQALAHLIKYLDKHQSDTIKTKRVFEIYGDAKRIITEVNKQLVGKEYKSPITKNIVNVMNKFYICQLKWIPRNINFYADYICQLARKNNGRYTNYDGNLETKLIDLKNMLLESENKAIRK
jgi:hypothetical protein